MVAVINYGASIKRTFLYNENKVRDGVAECLMAANYPLDLEQLSEKQKLNMLVKTASSNPDVEYNSMHISLNFAPGEQLSNSTLKEIAAEYMEYIGFGDQPYLVYRHDDAAHPHIHIATTMVRPDGTRINTHFIGKNRSEPARKAIENKYGLVKAEEHKKALYELKPVNAGKVIYGQEPTRKAINNVLQSVLKGYKYTSLAELNAVLNQYNILADKGTENSRVFKHQGLVYHVLDAEGKPVGAPLKASLLYNNPGLKFLEKQYLKNEVARQSHKLNLKNTIDLVLLRTPRMTIGQLAQKLKAEGIHLAVRKNSEGLIYGLTYVDHRTKCVFNGSALGKAYSAKALLERLGETPLKPSKEAQTEMPMQARKEKAAPDPAADQEKVAPDNPHEKSLLEGLMEYEHSSQYVPFDWKRKRKKKKKR